MSTSTPHCTVTIALLLCSALPLFTARFPLQTKQRCAAQHELSCETKVRLSIVSLASLHSLQPQELHTQASTAGAKKRKSTAEHTCAALRSTRPRLVRCLLLSTVDFIWIVTDMQRGRRRQQAHTHTTTHVLSL